MDRLSDINTRLSNARKKAIKQRLSIIASTLVVVAFCAIIIVQKHNDRIARAEQQELQRQAEHVAEVQRQREIAARRAEQELLANLEKDEKRIRAARAWAAEQETPKHSYTWSDLEEMVRNLTNEDYYASVWQEEMNTPKWVVLYSKGGKTYFRRFNPEKKTYGAKIRLIMESAGKYHASGNKRDRYYYGNGRILIHEVNGVEKQTFFNHRSIDLYTPTPVPDSYDDWEDYYYDNEEDFRNYYGR